MYIEDSEHMTALTMCMEEVVLNWGNLGALPKHIGWKDVSEPNTETRRYEFSFGDNGRLMVHEHDGDVQITLEA